MLLGRPAGDDRIFDNAPLLARFGHKDRDRSRAIAAELRDACMSFAANRNQS